MTVTEREIRDSLARPVAGTVLDSIGNTPVVELRRILPETNVRILVKLEGANPSGSVKDRIALALVDEFESRADHLEYILLEPTSGNTGIALAMVARVKGYRIVTVMPENVTPERRKLLQIFGAEIVDSPGELGSNGAIEIARKMDAHHDFWVLNQYANEANPRAHYRTTGVEILRDVPEVDVFVAGLGTGGTLTGVGRRLRESKPNVKIVAAEPMPGDRVQGLRSLAEGYVPPVLDSSLLDAKYLVSNDDAVEMMRRLASEEGIFTGVSSGAILATALRYARRMESGTIVALLPDGGWKYLSGDLWTARVEDMEEELESSFLW